MPKYDDIIDLERPVSKHEKMSIERRASIFSPFAALTGFNEKINDVERYREEKIILSEDEKYNLDLKIKEISKDLKRMVTITYYNHDDYKTINGYIKNTDEINKIIVLESKDKILFDNIIDICG